jgi:hypothetical protein
LIDRPVGLFSVAEDGRIMGWFAINRHPSGSHSMPRQRTEFGRCPQCGERVSVAVLENDYAWLIGDQYESDCSHCGAPLSWRFKDVGDWSTWAPIERQCRIRLRRRPSPGPESQPHSS